MGLMAISGPSVLQVLLPCLPGLPSHQPNRTLNSANQLITGLDQQLAPEARATLGELRTTLTEARNAIGQAQHSLQAIENTTASDSPLQQDTHETLRELSRAAQSFRALADYLERHPEALLRGKKEDAP